MTYKMMLLQSIVVDDCCCLWDMFLENVRDCGWSMARLKAEAEKCADRKELKMLVNKFI